MPAPASSLLRCYLEEGCLATCQSSIDSGALTRALMHPAGGHHRRPVLPSALARSASLALALPESDWALYWSYRKH